MCPVLRWQLLVGDANRETGGRKWPKVAVDVTLFLSVRRSLERSDRPSRGLRRTTDEDEVLIFEFKTIAIIRKLKPAIEVVAHVVDDMSLRLYVLATCGRL